VNNADHQGVHVAAVELSIGLVRAKPPWFLFASYRVDNFFVQGVVVAPHQLEETLQAAIVGAALSLN
jgi:hypothetical protein